MKKSDEIKIPVKFLVFLGVLVLIVILFLVFKNFNFSATGNVVSIEQAHENLLKFFAEQSPETNIQIVSSSKQNNFYEVFVNVEGEQFPVYITLDGNYLVVDMVPLN